MNGEYVCELVRAHYDGDDERFGTILAQIIGSEFRIGSIAVAERLTDIRRSVLNEGKTAVKGTNPR